MLPQTYLLKSKSSELDGQVTKSEDLDSSPVRFHYQKLRKQPMNEAETRAELIDPQLKASGWGNSINLNIEV